MLHQTPTSSAERKRSVKATDDAVQEENLLTVGEVARSLRVDTTTVRRWISTGVLEAVILPHRGKRQAYRIKQQTLDQILQAQPAAIG